MSDFWHFDFTFHNIKVIIIYTLCIIWIKPKNFYWNATAYLFLKISPSTPPLMLTHWCFDDLDFFSIYILLFLLENKLTRSDVAIHLTLPYTSGWVWFKGLDFHFLTPLSPHFGLFVFAFLVFWGPTNYPFKIWLSLLKWPRFLFFGPL